MKKILIMLAVVAMALSASAQTVKDSKPFDNIYWGFNGGVATKTTGVKWMDNLNPNVGLRIGRWFTPVFGLAVDGTAYLSNKPFVSTGTFIRATNVSLLGTANFTNWFGDYKGEPRCFEVIGLYGFGWGHLFRSNETYYNPVNKMTSKAAIDFTFNFGSQKEWQFYVEPAFTWAFLGSSKQPFLQDPHGLAWSVDQPRYDVNNSVFQLNGGFIYKFRCSNGTHNFQLADATDMGEVNRLNGIINDLRAQLDEKPREVVKEVVREVPARETVDNMVLVKFEKGKSIITQEQMALLNTVPRGTHVRVVGSASPEGNAGFNRQLSQDRADAVAAYLRDRGVIVDEAVGRGVEGITSNRLAIVYLK